MGGGARVNGRRGQSEWEEGPGARMNGGRGQDEWVTCREAYLLWL